MKENCIHAPGKRFLSLILICTMLIGLLPCIASAADVFGVVTGDKVFFRQKPSSSATYWEKLNSGWVMEILDTVEKDGKTWYYVEGEVPSKTNGSTYKGYILSDYFRPLTTAENAKWIANPTQGTISASASSATTTTTTTTSSTSSTASNGSYVKTNTSGVNLRASASTTAKSVTSVAKGSTLCVVSYSSGWYYVEYKSKYGYVQQSSVDLMTDSEIASYLKTCGSVGTATVKSTGGTLTLRQTRSTKATALTVIPNKTVLTIYDQGDTWCCTTYNGQVGWVLTSYLVFDEPTESGASTSTTSTTTATVTGTTYAATVKTTGGTLTLRETESTSAKALAYIPNKTSLIVLEKGSKWCKTTYNNKTGYVLTSYLTFSDSASSLSSYVYVKTDKVYVRKTPGGDKFTQVNKGVFTMWSSPVTSGSYTWYPIVVSGQNGYVRGDCAYQLTNAQYETYKSTGTVSTESANDSKDSGYIRTNTTSVNLRSAASTSATKVAQVNKNVVLKSTGTTTVSNVKWYKVTYEGTSCFVQAKYADMLTNAEYAEYLASQPTPTPTPAPTAVPSLSSMSDTAYTKVENVLVRKSASQSATSVTKIYNQNSYVTLTGKQSVVSGVYWYQVTYGSTTGWVRGDMIYIMSEKEKTAAGITTSTSTSTSTTSSTEYVAYTTLKLGSTGTAVKKLQQALADAGYLSADQVTGSYLNSTKTAVLAFQKAKSLTADGIAGQITQATLYGTPLYKTTVTDVTLYPVEMVDWYTGDIQKVWAKGTVAVITDVKTGLSFKAKRWSGAYHADVEPLTAADTAIMCKIYGVSNSQQILDKNLYQRRPLWVTVGGRTFAASMYGVPHNYPAGDTIANNDYSGQFCVHFVNSKTHGTSKVDADHQAAIKYAYQHAPSKK